MESLSQERSRDSSIQGKEIFEITPVILGGSATDRANKTFLTRKEHIEAVVFWNKIIVKLRAEHGSQKHSDL
jgi:hypothetical protein